MENSDAPGIRGKPGGHRASGRGRDSPDAHFFFADVLTPAKDMTSYTSIFSNLCEQVGLSIKTAKNVQGQIATFAGVELNTKLMVVRLPSKKLEKRTGHG